MQYMEKNKSPLANQCSFSGIKPAMTDMPYPPLQVKEKNQGYAALLSVDYCGCVSEMSAIAQYINNENRLSCTKCSIARTILGIAMAEMMHLQKLGEMIYLLGGVVDFAARQRSGKKQLWTPAYLTIPESPRDMLVADIEAEKAAIAQYQMHMRMMDDDCVNTVLSRIIQDEEYHIMLLHTLWKEI
jgi:bacterioferritin